MKKLLLFFAAVPFSSLSLAGQEVPSPGQEWTGLLVSASCQASSSAGKMDRTTAVQPRMPRTTPLAPGEQNTTYEQTQNQAARSKTNTRDQMARTTDRGTSVDQSSNDSLARTTTPPIDDKGTRGKATINNTAADDATSRSGLAQQNGPAPNPAASGSDAEIVKTLDPSCRVGQNTRAFALRLSDGSMVPFDAGSNSKIAQQLQSGDRLRHKSKIFRTKAKGSMRSGAISADSIQM